MFVAFSGLLGVDQPIPLLSRDLGSDVRFGSKADVRPKKRDVCFTPKNGHQLSTLGCPLCANKGHAKKEPQERNALGVRSLTERLGCRGDGGRRPDRVSLIAEQPTKPN